MATWLTRCSREKRNMDAAKRFFQQALQTVGHAPERVTTDGHDSYPRAIRQTLGSDVLHRTNHSLNNRLQPRSSWDQTALLPDAWVWRRYVCLTLLQSRGMSFASSFESGSRCAQQVSLVQQRDLFRQRLEALKALVLVA